MRLSVLLPVYHSVRIKATGDALPSIVTIAGQEGFMIIDLSVAEDSLEFSWAGRHGLGTTSLASTTFAGQCTIGANNGEYLAIR